MNFHIVPTLCVGMLLETLSVSHRWSGASCIPTQSVGTIKKMKKNNRHRA